MFNKKPKRKFSTISQSTTEKLRDELFEVRVDIKAYIRNINVLIICATLVISILAFFGYNKIDSVEKQILEKANNRLARTDSLLAKINEKKLDSINKILVAKQIEYGNTIKNFELVILQNKLLERKLFEILPANEQLTSFKYPTHYQEKQEDYFSIEPFGDKFNKEDKVLIYLKFSEKTDISKVECIGINIFLYNRHVLVKDKYYKVTQRLNKLPFQFDLDKGKYDMIIGYFTRINKDYHYYQSKRTIEIL
jgi:hypothetical protein